MSNKKLAQVFLDMHKYGSDIDPRTLLELEQIAEGKETKEVLRELQDSLLRCASCIKRLEELI